MELPKVSQNDVLTIRRAMVVCSEISKQEEPHALSNAASAWGSLNSLLADIRAWNDAREKGA